MEIVKKCGCKGVRTCLLCEKEGTSLKNSEEKVVDQYLYCPHCDLCWAVNSDERKDPLYLGRLRIIPDFITTEEEADLVVAIDSIDWMPSQSGRRKQDFGPKINFKRKKGKVGTFKGFPRFTKSIISKLNEQTELSDFMPVELCNLDYDPERGSAIEPHIDDTWIWGERLVTINLASPTILTFSPANHETTCDCQTQCYRTLSDTNPKNKHCNHRFPEVLNNTSFVGESSKCDHMIPGVKDRLLDFNSVKDMCTVYRMAQKRIEVLVPLPARSLVVVAGCCRHNWFHEIKRKDVNSRRLAMTFRELSQNFLEAGPDKTLGDELLELGRTFYKIDIKFN